VIARYLIGAAAWSRSQPSGKVIGGDGGAGTEVSGGAEGLEPDVGEGGKVTEALCTGLKYQTFSSLATCPAEGG
jgi:hypothetical protein